MISCARSGSSVQRGEHDDGSSGSYVQHARYGAQRGHPPDDPSVHSRVRAPQEPLEYNSRAIPMSSLVWRSLSGMILTLILYGCTHDGIQDSGHGPLRFAGLADGGEVGRTRLYSDGAPAIFGGLEIENISGGKVFLTNVQPVVQTGAPQLIAASLVDMEDLEAEESLALTDCGRFPVDGGRGDHLSLPVPGSG